MKKSNNNAIGKPEFSVLLTYDDPEQVLEINQYYSNQLSLLALSNRLDANEKLSQISFLTRQWQDELSPLLKLMSIYVYGCYPKSK